ncbi:hypothetical protein G6011_02303 [Alternaria panax]|uniref:Rhodopsin domain-containing protein n=1 Tax=Alternaria panax TaxID=48097 RepID=A0AAD4FE80_9PLEO|nr:hypothetical protein G6011_02303 [Alternaria panax]
MCDEQAQQENALISAQNHGTILVMVAWFLACLLAICAVARVIARYRSGHLRHLSSTDDVIIIAASIFALGSTVITSTAVDSGFRKKNCLLSNGDLEQIQLKLFVTTILFVLTVSLTKSSVLLFLYHLADNTVRRASVLVISILVLLWTIAVLAGMVFQCELPTPWMVWTGKCIPLIPFWMIATIFDIVLEIAVIVLCAHRVWTLRESCRQKTLATLLLSMRFILVAASVVRLVYLQQAYDRNGDPAFDSIPYAVATQGQTTLAVLVVCSLCLKPYARFETSGSQASKHKPRHSKNWSGSITIGGTPYESYKSFPTSITREPLFTIQASMSQPNSPAASRHSLNHDILLPNIPVPTRSAKRPPRPPPPSEEQRPDLSMFTRNTTIRQPPVVTRLVALQEKESTNGLKARSQV